MHLTQPALSRTLNQLERHLAVRLVDRSTHHLQLTSAGEDFLVRAQAALAAVDAIFEPEQFGVWPLRVGHAWSAVGERTGPLLREWRKQYPDVPLKLLRIDERTAGLLRGEVDVALLRGPIFHSRLHIAVLTSEARVAAVPSDSELVDKDPLTLGDLAAYPIVLNTVSGSTTLKLWPTDEQPPGFVEVTNSDDWLAVIAAGRAVGVTTVATADIHPYPGVTYRPLSEASDIVLNAAWTDPPTHPKILQFVETARRILEK